MAWLETFRNQNHTRSENKWMFLFLHKEQYFQIHTDLAYQSPISSISSLIVNQKKASPG